MAGCGLADGQVFWSSDLATSVVRRDMDFESSHTRIVSQSAPGQAVDLLRSEDALQHTHIPQLDAEATTIGGI